MITATTARPPSATARCRPRRAPRGCRCAPGSSPPPRTSIALIFILPYLEMIVMAVRPHDELGDRDYFPKHFTFSNFTTIWSARPGHQHRDQPGDRRRRHRARAAGRAARRVLHRPPPVPRPQACSCCWCWPPRCSSRPPCWSASSGSSPTRPAPTLCADPHQRRLQPRLRGVDPQRLLLLDPRRARGGGHGRRPQPHRRDAPGHDPAGRARHRHRADLHLHLRLERVPRRPDPQPRRTASSSR